jgi:hypothetical protein
MIKIICVLASLISITACSNCLVENGVYASYGGSEYSTRLELLKNNTFNLEYEVWSPGKKNESEIATTSGEWSCHEDKVNLNTGNELHSFTMMAIGKNPLGIRDDVKVLHFDEGGFEYLSRETLYPLSVLTEE